MNFRCMRRFSSIQLILGGTPRRAPSPSERAQKAVREHNTLNRRPRIDVLESNLGDPSVSWKSTSRKIG
jgi:hypothetical protein